MTSFQVAILVLLIGFVAGLRTMTSPAVVGWAAHLGWINLNSSKLAFLGSLLVVIFLTMGALGEFIGDKLPSHRQANRPGTPARSLHFGWPMRCSIVYCNQPFRKFGCCFRSDRRDDR